MIYVKLRIDGTTDEILGFVASSSKIPALSERKQSTIIMDVLRNHPAIYDQTAWHAPKRIILGTTWGRELRRKDEKQR